MRCNYIPLVFIQPIMDGEREFINHLASCVIHETLNAIYATRP